MKDKFYDLLRAFMLPLKLIDQNTPKIGSIIELGCGEGVISRYLARSTERNIVGVDINKKRLVNSKLSNLTFKHGDIRKYDLKNVDAVILSDVLHHLNFQEQEDLLKRISKSLKKHKKLIIKEIDTNEFLRSRLSRFWDFVFYPKEKIAFSNSIEMKRLLKSLGFKVEFLRAARFFPGSTTLYICQKK